MNYEFDPSDRPDPEEAFFVMAEPCENCGTPCEPGTRVWVPGFDYFGCDDCANEACILIFAEENCPVLYDAVMRAPTVSEVQIAFKQHQDGCPNCNPARKKAA